MNITLLVRLIALGAVANATVEKAGAQGERGRPAGNSECALPPALDAPIPVETDDPVVQVALLLDTSNSMDGLIDQARSQLWGVVNEIAKVRHDCKPVQLQVALFQYGNDDLESSDQFVQLRVPFTTDLDIVSEQLFSLRTRGGSEYCGAVIAESVARLNWIAPRDAGCGGPVSRLMVIAGNEPFSQGTVPYPSSIASATNKGIVVHTVFCGSHAEGGATFWSDGAKMGEGRYLSIDQGLSRIEVPTPFDVRISELNSRLNSTYIPYGERGVGSLARQAVQDQMNSSSHYASNARMQAKADVLYRNDAWDLVDASTGKGFEVSRVDRSSIPEEFRNLSDEALAAVLDEKVQDRAGIQREIRGLIVAREKFLAERSAAAETGDLGSALSNAIAETMLASGFKRDEK